MISHPHRCIFIHAPRTAGTSVEIAFTGIDWGYEYFDYKHLTACKAKLRYKKWWSDYFKFSTVRNPYERVVSYFNWNMCRLKDETFRNFLLRHRSSPEELSVESLCSYINESVDFIIRYENLYDDLKTVCTKLSGILHRKVQLMLPTAGASHRTITWQAHYSEPWMVDFVKSLYKEDFERFGYGNTIK